MQNSVYLRRYPWHPKGKKKGLRAELYLSSLKQHVGYSMCRRISNVKVRATRASPSCKYFNIQIMSVLTALLPGAR